MPGCARRGGYAAPRIQSCRRMRQRSTETSRVLGAPAGAPAEEPASSPALRERHNAHLAPQPAPDQARRIASGAAVPKRASTRRVVRSAMTSSRRALRSAMTSQPSHGAHAMPMRTRNLQKSKAQEVIVLPRAIRATGKTKVGLRWSPSPTGFDPTCLPKHMPVGCAAKHATRTTRPVQSTCLSAAPPSMPPGVRRPTPAPETHSRNG